MPKSSRDLEQGSGEGRTLRGHCQSFQPASLSATERRLDRSLARHNVLVEWSYFRVAVLLDIETGGTGLIRLNLLNK